MPLLGSFPATDIRISRAHKPETSVSAGVVPSWRLWGDSSRPVSWLPVGAGGCSFSLACTRVTASLPPSSQAVLCVRLSDPCEVTVIGGQRPHSRMTSSASLFTSSKALFSNRGHILTSRGTGRLDGGPVRPAAPAQRNFLALLSSLLRGSQIRWDLPLAPGLLLALSPTSRMLVLSLS